MRFQAAIVSILFAATVTIQAAPKPSRAPFTVVEASIPEMQAALKAGRVTSRQLVQQYLDRIATYEDKLNAAITVNPRALEEADERDRERAQGKIRGPLHGIPVAIKDNIMTTNMPTTGGALAFDGYVPPYEATVTKSLRDGGAIIIAKTQMTELANWVAASPGPMPNNYNGLHGYGFNPYDPRRDPAMRRSTAGRRSIRAARAAEPVPRPASGLRMSVPKPQDRSSAPPIRTCSPESSRRSVVSAAMA